MPVTAPRSERAAGFVHDRGDHGCKTVLAGRAEVLIQPEELESLLTPAG